MSTPDSKELLIRFLIVDEIPLDKGEFEIHTRICLVAFRACFANFVIPFVSSELLSFPSAYSSAAKFEFHKRRVQNGGGGHNSVRA